MANKTTNKKPAKPAPAKASRPPTARIAAKPAVKSGKSPAKPTTARLQKAARRERPQRHDKPGTGRISRAVSVERVRPEPGAARIERRVSEASPMPAASKLASPFGTAELNEWRKILLDHRAEISSDIQHLEQGAMEAEDGHTTPNHIAERGSDAEMQDMSLGLAGEEQVVLWQIDRALRKIDQKLPLPFGLCEHTKNPIPKTRLQLIPWTPVSIEGMNYVEEHGVSIEDILLDG